MEWAAVAIAGIALVISLFHFRRRPSEEAQPVFVEPLVKTKKRNRPVVRDDLAAWRQEEQERLDWEQELKRRESRDGR